jgi:hypothetical protein
MTVIQDWRKGDLGNSCITARKKGTTSRNTNTQTVLLGKKALIEKKGVGVKIRGVHLLSWFL